MIIDGWVEKKAVVKRSPYVFPNSGIEISRDCSMRDFCVELTKEVVTMLNNGVGFDTCLDCAYEWAGEWGGFIGSEKALAYTLLSNKPVFIIEDVSDLPTPALKTVYGYWLRNNEWRAGKKEQLLHDWESEGRIEFPNMTELFDRLESGGKMGKIIDGWEKEELKPEKKGNHITNYREVSVTDTETYSPVPLSSYGSYSLFSTGTGTVTSSHTFIYGTTGRRVDE